MKWVFLASESIDASTEDFCEAIDVWIERPNVISKIHSCSVTTEVETEDGILKIPEETKSFVDNFVSETIVCPKCNSNLEQSFKDFSLKHRKLVPKKPDHFRSSCELLVCSGHCFLCIPLQTMTYKVNRQHPSFLISHHKCCDSSAVNLLLFVANPNQVDVESSDLSNCALKECFVDAKWFSSVLLPTLVRWSSAEQDKDDLKKELPPSNSLVDREKYSILYNALKKKYGQHLARIWPEVTDPQKYVYEDVAIATYLLVLWEEERTGANTKTRQSFIDLGCGNGLLVHILNSEGHPGKGVDVHRRKIWQIYGAKTCLEEKTATPDDIDMVEGYDWILGNHSDELTPWIPVMAARSGYNTRYWVLPCCFYDFYGKYERKQSTSGQYHDYLNFVKSVGKRCGFDVEVDVMRIPSTKRVCHVGSSRNYQKLEHQNTIRSIDVYLDAMKTNEDATFSIRPKVQKVKNCTKMDRSVQQEIVTALVRHLLTHRNVLKCSSGKMWNRGGKIPLEKAILLVDKQTRLEMKKECGGLQTLLRNHHQVFEVRGGHVTLRDWREDTHASNNHKGAGEKSAFFKTKPCWFYCNHPDGCPREKQHCTFAHGLVDGQCGRLDVNGAH